MKQALSIKHKEIWEIAYPIMLGSLAQTILAVTDTAFLGRISAIALGASMMAGLFYYVFATLTWGFAIGIQILISRRVGEEKLERVGVIFQHGLRVVLIFGALLLAILYFFTPTLLDMFITSPNILESANIYMKYRMFGIIFVSLNYLFRYFYIGISWTKVVTLTTVIMSVVNIALDYVFIFGKLGFPEMGIGGAALASVFAELSATIVFIVFTIKKLPLKKYAMNVYHKYEPWLINHLFKIATPTMLQKLLSFGVWFIFFMIIEHMGEIPIAVSGVVRSLYMLLGIPVFAYAATANTITSRLIGAKRSNEVLPTLIRICKMSAITVFPIILLCFFLPKTLLSVYTNDPELIMASVPTVRVLCLIIISFVPGMIFFDAVSGTGFTTVALIVEVITLFLYLSAAYVLAVVLKSEVSGVWLTEVVYGISLTVFCYIFIRFYDWRKKVI